jgi:hypothetical protein
LRLAEESYADIISSNADDLDSWIELATLNPILRVNGSTILIWTVLTPQIFSIKSDYDYMKLIYPDLSGLEAPDVIDFCVSLAINLKKGKSGSNRIASKVIDVDSEYSSHELGAVLDASARQGKMPKARDISRLLKDRSESQRMYNSLSYYIDCTIPADMFYSIAGAEPFSAIAAYRTGKYTPYSEKQQQDFGYLADSIIDAIGDDAASKKTLKALMNLSSISELVIYHAREFGVNTSFMTKNMSSGNRQSVESELSKRFGQFDLSQRDETSSMGIADLYHGSPVYFTEFKLKPHFLSGPKPAVFATASKGVALVMEAYDWKDEDADFGNVDTDNFYLGEMWDGSFDKFWKGAPMYLYVLDSKGFEHIPGLQSFELVSYEQPKIKKIIRISDTYKAIKDSGEIELIPHRVYKHLKL